MFLILVKKGQLKSMRVPVNHNKYTIWMDDVCSICRQYFSNTLSRVSGRVNESERCILNPFMSHNCPPLAIQVDNESVYNFQQWLRNNTHSL